MRSQSAEPSGTDAIGIVLAEKAAEALWVCVCNDGIGFEGDWPALRGPPIAELAVLSGRAETRVKASCLEKALPVNGEIVRGEEPCGLRVHVRLEMFDEQMARGRAESVRECMVNVAANERPLEAIMTE